MSVILPSFCLSFFPLNKGTVSQDFWLPVIFSSNCFFWYHYREIPLERVWFFQIFLEIFEFETTPSLLWSVDCQQRWKRKNPPRHIPSTLGESFWGLSQTICCKFEFFSSPIYPQYFRLTLRCRIPYTLGTILNFDIFAKNWEKIKIYLGYIEPDHEKMFDYKKTLGWKIFW